MIGALKHQPPFRKRAENSLRNSSMFTGRRIVQVLT